jgi:hypothetical protein
LGKVLIFSLLHARVSTEIALPAAFYEGMTDAAFQQVSLISLKQSPCLLCISCQFFHDFLHRMILPLFGPLG